VIRIMVLRSSPRKKESVVIVNNNNNTYNDNLAGRPVIKSSHSKKRRGTKTPTGELYPTANILEPEKLRPFLIS
jgi:hypothetical protein